MPPDTIKAPQPVWFRWEIRHIDSKIISNGNSCCTLLLLLPGRAHAELLGPADGALAGDGGTSVLKDHLLLLRGVGLAAALEAVDLVTGIAGHMFLLLD